LPLANAQAQAGPLAAASQPFATSPAANGECWLEGQWPS
jgi:hypothetical protein